LPPPVNLVPIQSIPVPKFTSTGFEVYMRCVTWTRDSNGLFDYESKNIAKKNIKTQTGGKIIRIGDEI